MSAAVGLFLYPSMVLSDLIDTCSLQVWVLMMVLVGCQEEEIEWLA